MTSGPWWTAELERRRSPMGRKRSSPEHQRAAWFLWIARDLSPTDPEVFALLLFYAFQRLTEDHHATLHQ